MHRRTTRSVLSVTAIAFMAVLVLAGCQLRGLFGLGTKHGTDTVSGKITIAGYPVQGVTVTAGSSSATTDSNGNYTIKGLSNGSYTVTPSKANYGFSPTSTSVKVGSSSGTSGIDFSAGPALPVPTSYTQNLPNESAPIFIKRVPLNVSFSPTITAAIVPSGPGPVKLGSCISVGGGGAEEFGSPGPERVTLVNSSGSIVTAPKIGFAVYNDLLSGTGCSLKVGSSTVGIDSLTQKPILELTAFWKLLSVQRYAANTSTTYSQTVTYGVTSTSTTTFSNTFNASLGVNIGAVQATLSDAFTATVTNTMSITKTTSTTNSYTVNPGNKEGVLAIWQLVYQVQAVRKATASEIAAGKDQFGNPVEYGYVAFTDPNFIDGSTDGIDSKDVAPLDIQQQSDIVPQMTLFAP